MRVTTFIGLAGLVVMGIIVADILIHPQGTTAAGKVITGVITPTEAALLGNVPSGYKSAA